MKPPPSLQKETEQRPEPEDKKQEWKRDKQNIKISPFFLIKQY
jgi:hypothetical protein